MDRIVSASMSSRLGSARQKLSAWEKGSVRALSCNALWTNSRALRYGYHVSPLCLLCHAKIDSLFQIVWECMVCQEDRVELVGVEIITWARAACDRNSPDLVKFLIGAFAHPGTYVPPPVSQK
eukprot:6289736-Pyramimonas_sp.AAC.1